MIRHLSAETNAKLENIEKKLAELKRLNARLEKLHDTHEVYKHLARGVMQETDSSRHARQAYFDRFEDAIYDATKDIDAIVAEILQG